MAKIPKSRIRVTKTRSAVSTRPAVRGVIAVKTNPILSALSKQPETIDRLSNIANNGRVQTAAPRVRVGARRSRP